MRTLAHAVLIILLLTATAGAAIKPYPYNGALRHATHKGQAYDAFTWDAKVIWYATFFTDPFRAAYAKKHATIYHMGPVETEEWTQDQLHEQGQAWDVFISIYTKRDYKKFSLDPDTFWELFLTAGNGDVVWPTSIEQVSVTPYERIMFHHINRWSKCYKVRFPKADLGSAFDLTLQSIVGQSTVQWRNLQRSEL